MRAVNLIPADQRGGGGGLDGGASGGAVYILLGGLAMLALLVGVWAMTGSRLSDDRAELQRLEAEVAAAQAQSAQLQSTDTIRVLREQRAQVVRVLAASRIDWATSLDALARTLPAHTSLTKLTASSVPGATPGGTGAAGAVASSTLGPSIQLGGCSPTQASVARLMPRLHAVPGVVNVSLVRTQKAATGDAAAAGEGDCAGVNFEMVMFFAAATPDAVPADPAATATATTPPAGAPTPVAAPAPELQG